VLPPSSRQKNKLSIEQSGTDIESGADEPEALEKPIGVREMRNNLMALKVSFSQPEYRRPLQLKTGL
jgi:hypothetical protein